MKCLFISESTLQYLFNYFLPDEFNISEAEITIITINFYIRYFYFSILYMFELFNGSQYNILEKYLGSICILFEVLNFCIVYPVFMYLLSYLWKCLKYLLCKDTEKQMKCNSFKEILIWWHWYMMSLKITATVWKMFENKI